MKIQYLSDIHLEMTPNSDYWSSYRLEPKGDILVLAGDITKLHKSYFDHPFFDNVSNGSSRFLFLSKYLTLSESILPDFEGLGFLRIQITIMIIVSMIAIITKNNTK